MSTFTTSRGTRTQHVAPKFQSAPYRQHPSRREHIHGPIQPMDEQHGSTRAWLWLAAACFAPFAAAWLSHLAQ